MLSNYADDNNLISTGKGINNAKETLAKDFGVLTNWFYENVLVSSSKKCHLICIDRDGKDACYKNSKEEVILGIAIDLLTTN